jgi:hypothetical protein
MKKLSVIPMCVAMLAMVSYGGNSNEKGNSKAAKLIVLQPEDDAATSALGKGWRTPVRPVK